MDSILRFKPEGVIAYLTAFRPEEARAVLATLHRRHHTAAAAAKLASTTTNSSSNIGGNHAGDDAAAAEEEEGVAPPSLIPPFNNRHVRQWRQPSTSRLQQPAKSTSPLL